MFVGAGDELRELLAKLLHLGHRSGVNAIGLVLGLFVFELLGHLGLLRSAALTERLLHFFRQTPLQVLVDLASAGVEDAVDTEVQLGAGRSERFPAAWL